MTSSLLKFNESSPKVCLKLNWNNKELALLCCSISLSAQTAIPFKSWTTRMLSLGAFVILKKVSEEMIEFVIAVCCDRPKGVCEECADLIYHILLLFVGFEIKFERLFEALQSKFNQVTSTTSLMCLDKTALKAYDNIVWNLIGKLESNRKFENAIDVMIRKLYLSVSLLTTLCLQININAKATAENISNAVCEVFINAITLLHSRGLRYQSVANLLIARCCH